VLAFGKRLETAGKNLIALVLRRLLSQPDRKSPRRPQPPYRRILFIRYGGIGDMILSIPVLKTARARFPDAEMDILCDAKNAGPLLGTGLADRVYCYEKNPFRTVRLLLRLGRRRYDYVCNLVVYPSFTFGLISRLVGPGAVRSAGDQERYAYLYNRVLELPPKREIHMLKRLFLLAADITGPEISGTGKPWFDYGADIKEKAQELYRDAVSRLGAGSEKPRIAALNLSAGLARREWPVEKNVRFLQTVLGRYRERLDGWVVFSDPGRKERASALVESLPDEPVTVVPPQDDFRVLMEFVRHVYLIVTPDTSFSHLASAAGTPALVLMIGENAATWAPFDIPHQVAVSDSPTELEGLPVEAVLRAFDRLMETIERG